MSDWHSRWQPVSGPAYTAAVLVTEIITAALLLSLFAIQRSRGFLLLASGYLFSSIMVVPWVLTFPGVAELPA
jgi:hypothetical protein